MGATMHFHLSTASAPSDSYKYPFDLKSSGGDDIFQKHDPTPPPPRTLVRGDSDAAPGTLPEGRSIPESSTSPCLPPGWSVSSSTLDYGSMSAARWLSVSLVLHVYDLVSCITWSRSIIVMLCDVFAGIRWIIKLWSDCAWFLYVDLCSCMLSDVRSYFGQVIVCISKREYLC